VVHHYRRFSSSSYQKPSKNHVDAAKAYNGRVIVGASPKIIGYHKFYILGKKTIRFLDKKKLCCLIGAYFTAAITIATATSIAFAVSSERFAHIFLI